MKKLLCMLLNMGILAAQAITVSCGPITISAEDPALEGVLNAATDTFQKVGQAAQENFPEALERTERVGREIARALRALADLELKHTLTTEARDNIHALIKSSAFSSVGILIGFFGVRSVYNESQKEKVAPVVDIQEVLKFYARRYGSGTATLLAGLLLICCSDKLAA